MTYVVLFVATSIIFLVADAIMLRGVIQPLFAKHLGDQLYDGGFRMVPAVLFYLVHMLGILYFCSVPALQQGTPSLALLNGAILGLVAYGTYELTSWAVMRDWSAQMVAVDLTWGTVLTAGSAWGGLAITRAIMG
jgi:uncharacterized membrane protein